ncbi:MAG: amidophosphoribosyltransferase [Flavobacteriaceae bacterium]|nr:MAG: amidophosphoribosyltransferase [Flavobacteriaceae bacterium]
MQILKDIFYIFFPNDCLGCDQALHQHESYLCTYCRHDLALTYFTNEKDNRLERSFYGRIKIKAATSLLYYEKHHMAQELIHLLKYKNQQQIGVFIGDWMGIELKNSPRFRDLDCIVPVPLHPNKLQSRGFNQLDEFGKRLSHHLEIPFMNKVLIKKTSSNSQTKKGRFARINNTAEIFTTQQEQALTNKHILLIDDVITTGATMEACYNALILIPGVTVSLVTMTCSKS